MLHLRKHTHTHTFIPPIYIVASIDTLDATTLTADSLAADSLVVSDSLISNAPVIVNDDFTVTTGLADLLHGLLVNDGMTVATGPAIFNDELRALGGIVVTGDVSLAGALSVFGELTVNSAQINDLTSNTVTTALLQATNAVISNSLVSNGPISANAGLTVQQGLQVSGQTDLQGLAASGNAVFNGPLNAAAGLTTTTATLSGPLTAPGT